MPQPRATSAGRPWHTDPGQVTALTPATATNSRAPTAGTTTSAARERALCQAQQLCGCQPRARLLQRAEHCPRAMGNTWAPRNPHCRASLQPQNSTTAVSQGLPLLCPLSSPDTPDGAWHPRVFGKHPSTCSGAPAATLPLPPPAHTGALGCPRVPSPSPGLPTSSGQSQSSSYRERIFGRKQLRRVSVRGPFGLPGEPLQSRGEHGVAGTSLSASNPVPVSAHPCFRRGQRALLGFRVALTG